MYMTKVFTVIISGWWVYGDDFYFLFASLSFLKPAHVVFNKKEKYFKSKRRPNVQGKEDNGEWFWAPLVDLLQWP